MNNKLLGLAAGVLLAGTAGSVGFLARGSDGARVARLEASADTLRSERDRLARERDRIRAERDALEQRIAAERTPAACPKAFLRTSDADITPLFGVDYPCGWHVLWEPGQQTAEPGRQGLIVDALFVGRLPINRSPGAGTLTDIQLEDWSDDPSDTTDGLPALEAWLADERTQFESPPKEERARTADGLAVVRLTGPVATEDRTRSVTLDVWEYVDPGGRRHIVRVSSADPGPEVRGVLQRLVGSFRASSR